MSILNDVKSHIENSKNVDKKMPVAIFDIDGTLLDDSNGLKEYYEPNREIVQIAQQCRKHGLRNIVLTARPLESRLASRINLQMHGIPYDKIITNDKNEAPTYKRKIRKELAEQYHVVLAVGDKVHDYDGSGPETMKIRVEKGIAFKIGQYS